ncbi:MAG: SCP2 sterol-binding domain-containing protein [Deltaproteobacteria bacterium]|nr:SCP2 sterol-binding domain-containing protein [Deltaproteobacteria bacterium]
MAGKTPKELIEEKILPWLQSRPDLTHEIGGAIQFDITGPNGGHWTVDCSASPVRITPAETPSPSCRIEISDNDFVRLISGELSPQIAFVTGKLRVQGDLSIALKFGKLLQ